ncbi:MAG: lipopolysaccharide biosynthesis protein [Gammaproteobacteria bacterium]
MKLRAGRFARGSLVSASGLVARAALQATYLVAVSRWLGVEGYGVFGTAVATAVLLAPLSSWGAGYVYMEEAARRSALRSSLWRIISLQTIATGCMLAAIAFIAAQGPVDLQLATAALVAILVGEVIALPLAQMLTTVLVTAQRPWLAATSVCAVPFARVLGVLALVVWSVEPSITAMAISHGGTSALAGLFVMLVAWHGVDRTAPGRSSVPVPGLKRRLLDGAPYALGALVGLGYLEVDKLLILQLAGPTSAGTYTAAFRVAMVLFIPVTALLANALPRLMAARQAGATTVLLPRVVIVALTYAALAALLAWSAAPLMPRVFGVEFTAASGLLVLLAGWLPLATLHQCGASALLAQGHKTLRLLVETVGVGVVVGANLVLLPAWGAEGAVGALVCAETQMSIACWWLYHHYRRREGRGSAVA